MRFPVPIRIFIPWQYFSMMGIAKQVAELTLIFFNTIMLIAKLVVLLIIFLSIFASKKLIGKADLL